MSKRNEEKLTHKVFARVSEKKYEELCGMLARSRCKTLCELVRNILTDKKIVVETYDPTLDVVMEELMLILKQIKAIGGNINQVTHRIHREKLPKAQQELVLDLTQLYQQTELKLSGLFTVVAQLSEKWLPE